MVSLGNEKKGEYRILFNLIVMDLLNQLRIISSKKQLSKIHHQCKPIRVRQLSGVIFVVYVVIKRRLVDKLVHFMVLFKVKNMHIYFVSSG